MSDAPEQFRIHWRNRDTGRTGIGTKTFTQIEAEQLSIELNRDFPNIEHLASDAAASVFTNNHALNAPLSDAPPSAPIRPFVPLIDSDPFPNFGIHARKRMGSIDSSYWDWFRGQPQLMRAWPEIAEYIKRNARSIDEDLERADRQ